MNTLASCYGYLSQPWFNLDPITTPINYYDPAIFSDMLLSVAAKPLANVMKSHHTVGFFGDSLSRLTQRYAIFYIYRNPVPVMLSSWHFMHRWPWAGPCLPDPVAFARAAQRRPATLPVAAVSRHAPALGGSRRRVAGSRPGQPGDHSGPLRRTSMPASSRPCAASAACWVGHRKP